MGATENEDFAEAVEATFGPLMTAHGLAREGADARSVVYGSDLATCEIIRVTEGPEAGYLDVRVARRDDLRGAANLGELQKVVGETGRIGVAPVGDLVGQLRELAEALSSVGAAALDGESRVFDAVTASRRAETERYTRRA